MGTRKGFTLVETLVAIGVIAILLGITLPMLRGAVQSTDQTLDLANLRSTHQQFYQWGVEHKDRFVNQGPPLPGQPIQLRAGANSGSVTGPYGLQQTWWTWTLAGWLQKGHPTWHPRRAPRPDELESQHFARLVNIPGGEHCYPSAFRMSYAMLCDPRRFLPGCYETPAESLYRYVRWGETAYPGQKALLFWVDSSEPAEKAVAAPVIVANFVDGSARVVDPSVAVVLHEEQCADEPFDETPMGILGVDTR